MLVAEAAAVSRTRRPWIGAATWDHRHTVNVDCTWQDFGVVAPVAVVPHEALRIRVEGAAEAAHKVLDAAKAVHDPSLPDHNRAVVGGCSFSDIFPQILPL